MTKTYTILDSGGVVQRVEFVDDDAAPPEVEQGLGVTEVSSFAGWPTDPRMKLRMVSGQLVAFDPRSLEDVRSDKRAEINAARLAANKSTFTFQGKQIQCDELSRGDIDGVSSWVSLAGTLPPNFPGAWKALDNSFVVIPDVAAWTQFIGAMVSQGTSNFGRSQALKAQVDAAQTIQELEAVKWDESP